MLKLALKHPSCFSNRTQIEKRSDSRDAGILFIAMLVYGIEGSLVMFLLVEKADGK